MTGVRIPQLGGTNGPRLVAESDAAGATGDEHLAGSGPDFGYSGYDTVLVPASDGDCLAVRESGVVGYQRPFLMGDRVDQVRVAGLNRLASGMPWSSLIWPPLTSSRPSG